jgi:hypothetical protein
MVFIVGPHGPFSFCQYNDQVFFSIIDCRIVALCLPLRLQKTVNDCITSHDAFPQDNEFPGREIFRNNSFVLSRYHFADTAANASNERGSARGRTSLTIRPEFNHEEIRHARSASSGPPYAHI